MMPPIFYALDDDNRPVAMSDLVEWSKWAADHQDRLRVAEDHIGDARVSTVYLGVDMRSSLLPPGPPMLWETMIFHGPYDLWRDRYESHDAALAGHAAAVALVRSQ